jgi:hypothetical protein
MASEDEWVVVQLNRPTPLDLLGRRFSAELPDRFAVLSTAALERSNALQPQSIEYEVDLSLEGIEVHGMAARINEVQARQSLLILRSTKKRPVAHGVDVRPWIIELGIDRQQLTLHLSHTSEGMIRPAEALALLELPVERLKHQITRRRVHWREPISLDGERERILEESHGT